MNRQQKTAKIKPKSRIQAAGVQGVVAPAPSSCAQHESPSSLPHASVVSKMGMSKAAIEKLTKKKRRKKDHGSQRTQRSLTLSLSPPISAAHPSEAGKEHHELWTGKSARGKKNIARRCRTALRVGREGCCSKRMTGVRKKKRKKDYFHYRSSRNP